MVLKDKDNSDIKKAVCTSDNKAELGEGEKGERERQEEGMGCGVRAGEQQKQGYHGKIHHFVV